MRRLTDVASNDNDDLLEGMARGLLTAARRRSADSSFDSLERALLDVSNQTLRLALEAALSELAHDDSDVVQVGDESFRRHQKATVTYHSLCGSLRVERWTYRLVGKRNGRTIVPLEFRAGLIRRATPAFAYAIAEGYAKAPMRSDRQYLVTACRVPPSRSTMERMAKAIGTEMKKELLPIEQNVRASEEIPKASVGITLGLDRTSIPMEEEDEENPSRIVVRYRMAYVGTVALTNGSSEVLTSWKYASPACEGSNQVVRRMMDDVSHALRAKSKLHIGLVQDGAYDIWATMLNAVEGEVGRSRFHKAIDMYHLMERVSQALEVVEPDAQKRSEQLRRWKKQLHRDDSAIASIARFFELEHVWLRSERQREDQRLLSIGYTIEENGVLGFAPPSAKLPPPPRPRRWSEKQRAEVSKILSLYLANPNLFRYARMRRLGLHVGSGVTEGACKSLIAARAKRSGQRWRPLGISAVLTLRSLLESNRLTAAWRDFAKRHAPNVRAA